MGHPGERPSQASLWASVLSVLLILAAVAVGMGVSQRLSTSTLGASGHGIISRQMTIDVSFDAGLTQPDGVAVSPDGKRLGLFGEFTPCAVPVDALPSCGHGVAIYDIGTGSVIRLAPIELLLNITSPGASSTEHASAYLNLYGVGWSPDSAWYGMVYSVFDTAKPTTPDDLLDSGLLLINPDTGAARIVRGDSGYFSTSGNLAVAFPAWDVRQQTEIPSASLTPALSYEWISARLPVAMNPPHGPVTELPSSADTLATVGFPDGVAPFTVWQPGLVIGSASLRLPDQRSAFVSTFAAWSTDGDHVGLFTVGVALPTPVEARGPVSASPEVAAPYVSQPTGYVVAPERDRALARVQESVGSYGWALVAWRPSGDALASIVCFAHAGQTLEVRDTTTGVLIGRDDLSLEAPDPGCQDTGQSHKLGGVGQPNITLAWTPDGTKLIMADRSAATLTIWKATAR